MAGSGGGVSELPDELERDRLTGDLGIIDPFLGLTLGADGVSAAVRCGNEEGRHWEGKGT